MNTSYNILCEYDGTGHDYKKTWENTKANTTYTYSNLDLERRVQKIEQTVEKMEKLLKKIEAFLNKFFDTNIDRDE